MLENSSAGQMEGNQAVTLWVGPLVSGGPESEQRSLQSQAWAAGKWAQGLR